MGHLSLGYGKGKGGFKGRGCLVSGSKGRGCQLRGGGGARVWESSSEVRSRLCTCRLCLGNQAGAFEYPGPWASWVPADTEGKPG